MKLHVGGHLATLKIEKLTLQLGQEQKYPFTLPSGPCKPRHHAKELTIHLHCTSHGAKGTLALHQCFVLQKAII